MPDTQLNPDALMERIAGIIDSECEVYGATVDGSPSEKLYGEETDLPKCAAEKIMTLIRPFLAAALQEVTERGQLTALPEKIVLEDRRGTIWQKINGTWYTPGSKHDYSDQSVMLPARVLYRPEANDA